MNNKNTSKKIKFALVSRFRAFTLKSKGREKNKAHVDNNTHIKNEYLSSSLNASNDFVKSFTGYCSLFRYATVFDCAVQTISLLTCILSGFCIPIFSVAFGRFSKDIVRTIQEGQKSSSTIFPCGKDINDTVSNFDISKSNELLSSHLVTFFIYGFVASVLFVCLNAVSFICWYIPTEKQATVWTKAYIRGLLLKEPLGLRISSNDDGESDTAQEIIETVSVIRHGIGVQIPFAVHLISTFVVSLSTVLYMIYTQFFLSTSASLLLLCSLWIIPVVSFLQSLLAKTTTKQVVTAATITIPFQKLVQNILNGIQHVIVNNGQVEELNRFVAEQNCHVKRQKMGTIVGFLTGLLPFFMCIYFSLLFCYFVDLIWDDRYCLVSGGHRKFDIQLFFTVVFCVTFGMVNIWLVYPILISCSNARIVGAHVAHIIDSTKGVSTYDTRGSTLEIKKGKIQFEDVTLACPSITNLFSLGKLNITIEPGQKVAFVSMSGDGSGLSIILKLLLKQRSPLSGFIKLDNVDIRILNRQWYLFCIGYISSDPVFFNESIEDNIRKGKPSATMDDIEAACKIAKAHDWIVSLPAGYSTIIRNNGKHLNPRLRIQLAIARAVIRKPLILILDNPAANLDKLCETFIQEILDTISENMTTLLIPRRLDNLMNVDKIFVFNGGQIVEQGRYKELMSRSPVSAFHRMVDSQLRMRKPSDHNKSNNHPTADLPFQGELKFMPPSDVHRFLRLNIGFSSSFPRYTTTSVVQAWVKTKYLIDNSRLKSFEIEVSGHVRPLPNEQNYFLELEKDMVIGQNVEQLNSTLEQSNFTVPLMGRIVSRVKGQSGVETKQPKNVLDDTFWNYLIQRENKPFSHLKKEETNVSWYSVLPTTLTSCCCVLLGVLSSILLGLTLPLYAFLFGRMVKVLSETSKTKAAEQTKLVALCFLVYGIFLFGAIFVQKVALGQAAHKCFIITQQRMFACILRQDLEWFERPENKVAILKMRLSRDPGSLKYVIHGFYGVLIENIVGLVTSIILSFYLNPRLGLCTLLFIPLSLMTSGIDSILQNHYEEKRKNSIRQVKAMIKEVLENRETVSTFYLEHYFWNKLENSIDNCQETTFLSRASLLRCLSFGFSRGGAFILYSIFMVAGGQLLLSGDVTFEVLITIGELLIFEMVKIGTELIIIPTLNLAFTASSQVMKIMRRHPKICLDSGQPLMDLRGDLAFEDVHFSSSSYRQDEILKGISFDVKEKKTVALLGTADSGRSLCLQLALRLRDVQMGHVTIDGMDIEGYQCSHLRRVIGYFSYEPYIFARTIRENIAYGVNCNQNEIMSEIVWAAKKVNIHKFITSLPRGYETYIESTTPLLSISQQRRIALAKIFLQNPKILLIDETPAFLLESELQEECSTDEGPSIHDCLLEIRKDKTCIIVARRRSTVEQADLIVFLHNGLVVAKGEHEHLMRYDNPYRQLVQQNKQNKDDFFEPISIQYLMKSSHQTSGNESSISVSSTASSQTTTPGDEQEERLPRLTPEDNPVLFGICHIFENT